MNSTLYYVHDPMCSWCWGFNSTLTSLLQSLPDSVKTHRILGGLAPDSDSPMPADMQHMLQRTWAQIQKAIPGTEFNFDFWTNNQPRRSTWPSCRAVLAAKAQNAAFELPMISAIQQAYYQQARNPSDTDTLVSLAEGIGCDKQLFARELNSDVTQQRLLDEIQFARQLGAQGFPSLIFENRNNQHFAINVDYNNARSMLDQIEHLNIG